MSSSEPVGKDILNLGEWPKQGLDDTTLIAEVKYLFNFSRSQTKFCFNSTPLKQQFFIC